MIKTFSTKILLFIFLIASADSFGQWNLTGNSNAPATNILGTTNAIPVNLTTNNVSRMIIDANGKIGIATAPALSLITLKGAGSTPATSWVSSGAPLFAGFGETTAGNADFNLAMASATSNARGVIGLKRARGTLAVPAAVVTNDQLGSVLVSGYDGTNFQGAAAVDFFADGTPTTGNVPARISFVTGSNSGNRLERVRIGNTGNIAFNNTQLFVQQSNGAIGIGNAAPGASAILDITSTTKGMLVPRMTKAQRNAVVAPATGLLLYQTDDVNGFYYYSNGWKSLRGIDSANIFMGAHAGDSVGNTYGNTAFGNNSLQVITTGNNNTAVGSQTLNDNTVGFENAAFGAGALPVNTIGNYNSGLGNASLNNNISGNYNTGAGYWSLFFQNGDNNSALGFSAGDYTNGSSEGTFLGTQTQAGDNLNNITAVGFGATVTASNSVRVGNTAVTSIGGQVGWSNFSDGRFKKNVKENVPGLAFVNKLRPVTYNLDVNGMDEAFLKNNSAAKGGIINGMKHEKPQPSAAELKAKEDKAKIVYTGFIAQEVEKNAKELNYDFSGIDAPKNKNDFYALRYSEFVVPLVKSVQELSKQNEAKDALIQDQNKKIADLEERMNKLEAMMNGQKPVSAIKGQTVNVNSATLEQNVPNPPINNNTKISYNIPENIGNAEMIITDVYGKKVKQINIPNSGKGILNVNTTGLASGTYSYTLMVDGKVMETKKMVVAGN